MPLSVSNPYTGPGPGLCLRAACITEWQDCPNYSDMELTYTYIISADSHTYTYGLPTGP